MIIPFNLFFYLLFSYSMDKTKVTLQDNSQERTTVHNEYGSSLTLSKPVFIPPLCIKLQNERVWGPGLNFQTGPAVIGNISHTIELLPRYVQISGLKIRREESRIVFSPSKYLNHWRWYLRTFGVETQPSARF